MKIIVTGGCGFIGSNLVERLVKDRHSVIVFDNLSTGNLKNIEGLGAEFFNKPYSYLPSLKLKPDVVFHIGIPSSSPMYKENPKLVGAAVGDAIDVLEYVKSQGCKLVYASSSSIYNGNPGPYKEDMPVHVTDYYTEARYCIERLAKLYNSLHGVKSVGLRFFSVYGPRETFKGQYANIITQFLWQMKKDEVPLIFGDGSQTRDFTYVSDTVNALMLAMKKDFDCEVFNAGTGVANSFNDIVQLLNKALDKNIKPAYKPNPINNYVDNTLADTTKAAKALGFKAKVPLKDGIGMLLKAYP